MRKILLKFGSKSRLVHLGFCLRQWSAFPESLAYLFPRLPVPAPHDPRIPRIPETAYLFSWSVQRAFQAGVAVPYRPAQSRLRLHDEVVISRRSAFALVPPKGFGLAIRKLARKKCHPVWYQIRQRRHLYQLILAARQMSCSSAPAYTPGDSTIPARTGLSSTYRAAARRYGSFTGYEAKRPCHR